MKPKDKATTPSKVRTPMAHSSSHIDMPSTGGGKEIRDCAPTPLLSEDDEFEIFLHYDSQENLNC